jgi:Caspase domain
MPQFEQGHVLAIGVADYQDPDLKLSKPLTVADAKGVADALKDPGVAAYPPGQVQLIPEGGTRAIRAEVIRAFEQFAGRVGPNDTALVFYCGHGVLGEDGEYYLTTEDTVLTADCRVKQGTGLAKTKLMELLRAVKAQKVLFIINACFSGHFGGTLALRGDVLGVPPSSTMSVELLGTGKGRALITASRPTEYSYFTSQDSNTFFGNALIDGLRGKAVGHGGYVGLYELYQYIYETVRSRSGGRQNSVLTLIDGIGPFPLALHQGGTLGPLDPTAIDRQPPRHAAVELVEPAVMKAIGRGAQALDIQAGGNVSIDQIRKVVDFGCGNTMGLIKIGDVAGGNMTKINLTIAPATAARADDIDAVLKAIGSIRDELRTLPDVSQYDQGDADDELRKAQEAIADKLRMMEKLESAQKMLLKIGGVAEGGIKLAESVGVLIQRLLGM